MTNTCLTNRPDLTISSIFCWYGPHTDVWYFIAAVCSNRCVNFGLVNCFKPSTNTVNIIRPALSISSKIWNIQSIIPLFSILFHWVAPSKIFITFVTFSISVVISCHICCLQNLPWTSTASASRAATPSSAILRWVLCQQASGNASSPACWSAWTRWTCRYLHSLHSCRYMLPSLINTWLQGNSCCTWHF